MYYLEEKKDLNGADVELVRIYYARSGLKLRGQASESGNSAYRRVHRVVPSSQLPL